MSTGAVVANALGAILLFIVGLSLATSNEFIGFLILGGAMMAAACGWVIAMGVASDRRRSLRQPPQ